jgi:ribonuclease Z
MSAARLARRGRSAPGAQQQGFEVRPLLHPTLVNGRTGDPALYVETLFERRAILFDLGDITPLSPRKIQRLEHVFVSHTHIDHFIGFDLLLRVLVGRDKEISLCGPQGFIDQVHHKLKAYRWNLVDRYPCDLVFEVREIDHALTVQRARFRLKTAFARELLGSTQLMQNVVHSEATFRVSTTVLEHGTPCLGFAIEEAAHLNVWKNRLAQLGLPVGPWLRELKRAVIENRPDDHLIAIRARAGSDFEEMPLGRLRDAITVTPGQKIAYVTDVADCPGNRQAIIALAHGSDLLFLEAPFAAADASLAAARAHLTTTAAGEIARAAQVRRVEPFHFSPRYAGQEQPLLDEVQAAFAGG